MVITYHLLGILCYTLGSVYYGVKLAEAWRNSKNRER